MANNFFQFKQFTVQQENCSMKVSTDACIFGAFVASSLQHLTFNIQHILDIGTGTGLLPLILAQKSKALIDAVEINTAASLQAKGNFARSPWHDRLQVFNLDIKDFNPGKKYDQIISNPPFFEDDLRSADDAKNTAKHNTALTLVQLLNAVDLHLQPGGSSYVLLPFHRMGYFEKVSAGMGFHIHKKLLIRHTASHPYFRGILAFSKNKLPVENSELAIKESNGVYTAGLAGLLGDYYLYL